MIEGTGVEADPVAGRELLTGAAGRGDATAIIVLSGRGRQRCGRQRRGPLASPLDILAWMDGRPSTDYTADHRGDRRNAYLCRMVLSHLLARVAPGVAAGEPADMVCAGLIHLDPRGPELDKSR